VSREIVLLVFLVLVAYRATRLIVKDTFPLVLWLRDRVAGGYRYPTRAEMYHSNYPVGELEPHVTRIVPGLRGLWSLDPDGRIQVWNSHWKNSPHWLAELITCPWCASAYVSGALVLITDCVIGVQWPWLMGGAVWAGSSLISSRSWA
jgi:hypothetical protein